MSSAQLDYWMNYVSPNSTNSAKIATVFGVVCVMNV